MKLSGTPQTLDQAIEQAICIGPMSELKDRLYHILKDYIANKIQPFMFKTNDEQMLSDLFELLTKREPVTPKPLKPTPYDMRDHGSKVRVKEIVPPHRHGVVVEIRETRAECIDPMVLWDDTSEPRLSSDILLVLE